LGFLELRRHLVRRHGVDCVSRATDDTGTQAQELRISADLEHHLGPLGSLKARGAAGCEWKHVWSQHEVPLSRTESNDFQWEFLIHMKIAI
jgi:hypothetical protein